MLTQHLERKTDGQRMNYVNGNIFIDIWAVCNEILHLNVWRYTSWMSFEVGAVPEVRVCTIRLVFKEVLYAILAKSM